MTHDRQPLPVRLRFDATEPFHFAQLFARRAAHDIRNSIQAIDLMTSNMELAIRSGESGDDELRKIRKIAAATRDQTRRWQMFASKKRLHGGRCDLCSDDVWTQAELQASSAGMTLERVSPDLDRCEVALPAPEMLQSIEEIVSNAIGANASRVEARIETTAEGQVRLTLSDDGSGLPPEVTESLLRDGEGSGGRPPGLGLLVVAGIVTARGGSFSVGSGENGGTVAVLEMPAAEQAAESFRRSASRPLDSGDQIAD